MLPDFLKRVLSLRPASEPSSLSALGDYMALKRKPDRSKPLDEVCFVVFDTETSGLDFASNRLLTIAAVSMHGLELRLDDTFDVRIEQLDVGGADAAVVHGLISSDLAGGLPEDEAVARFLSYVRDSVLVAHHAAFDVRMLGKALKDHRRAKVWNPVVDTALLARRVEVGPMSSTEARGADDRESYRLDSLVNRYDIDIPERHTAAGDALATALLFQRLLKKAKRRGIQTLGDLLSR